MADAENSLEIATEDPLLREIDAELENSLVEESHDGVEDAGDDTPDAGEDEE